MKKPGVIKAMSIIMIVISGFSGLLELLMLVGPGPVSISLIIMDLVVTGLFLCSGLGILLGKKWGWWIGTCFLSILFIGCISNIIQNTIIVQNLDNGKTFIYFFIIFFLTGASVYYLFGKKTLEYFSLSNIPRIKLIIIPASLSIGIGLFSIIRYFIIG